LVPKAGGGDREKEYVEDARFRRARDKIPHDWSLKRRLDAGGSQERS
jgi:hypothetical protein